MTNSAKPVIFNGRETYVVQLIESKMEFKPGTTKQRIIEEVLLNLDTVVEALDSMLDASIQLGISSKEQEDISEATESIEIVARRLFHYIGN